MQVTFESSAELKDFLELLRCGERERIEELRRMLASGRRNLEEAIRRAKGV